MELLLKSGTMYKLGDGPVNYDWNMRFFVLNYQSQELTYFGSEEDQAPRGIIRLTDALISNITLIKEREHSFSLQCSPQPQGKIYFFSCNSLEESQDWHQCLIKASKLHKLQGDNSIPDQLQDKSRQEEPSFYEKFDEKALLEESDNESDGFIGLDQIKARMAQGIAAHFTTANKKDLKSIIKKRSNSRMGGRPTSEINNSTYVEATVEQDVMSQNEFKKEPTKEAIDNLKLIKELIIDDKSQWTTFKIDNGIEFQAVQHHSSNFKIQKKSFKPFIKLLAATILITYIISGLIQPFFSGVVIAFAIIKGASKLINFRPKLEEFRARKIIKGNLEETLPVINECFNQFKNLNSEQRLLVMPLNKTHFIVYIISSFKNLQSLSLLQIKQQDQTRIQRVSLMLSSIKESLNLFKLTKAQLDASTVLYDKSLLQSDSEDNLDTDENSQFQ